MMMEMVRDDLAALNVRHAVFFSERSLTEQSGKPAAGSTDFVGQTIAWLRERGHPGPALLLAVDLPAVDEPLLRWLRDRPGETTVVLRVDGRLHPVCARYGPDALLAAASLVAGGVRALHELGLRSDVRPQVECVKYEAGAICDRRGAPVKAAVEHRLGVLRIDDRDRKPGAGAGNGEQHPVQPGPGNDQLGIIGHVAKMAVRERRVQLRALRGALPRGRGMA